LDMAPLCSMDGKTTDMSVNIVSEADYSDARLPGGWHEEHGFGWQSHIDWTSSPGSNWGTWNGYADAHYANWSGWHSSSWWESSPHPQSMEPRMTPSRGSTFNGSHKTAQAASSQQLGPGYGSADEHAARVHFGKTYQVLSEVLETHKSAFQKVESFLDLGCAPGGFACRLLEEESSSRGYGVTLPVKAGGFPILFEHARLRVQACDIMELNKTVDLECSEQVDVCLADAQDLGRRTSRHENQRCAPGGKGKRGGWGTWADEQGNTLANQSPQAVGVRATCTVLGIWALTLQEMLLGLGRLREGGTFFFRFGWRGKGAQEETWYREATCRLLALILTHFSEVLPFKSEFSHQADSTFYVIATGFRREMYTTAGLDQKLRESIERVINCARASELPWCIEAIQECVPEDVLNKVTKLLDSVGRLRAIGMASRHRVEAGGRENPEAGLWISPVPFSLTLQRLRERLERYGKIAYIRRRAHAVGVGADAVVQFMQPAHAKSALEAITEMTILGDNITARRLSDVPPS